MKKFALALLCIVSVAFFASCKKDNKVENPEPSIAVITEQGYVADGDTVNMGQQVYFGFTMASNTETQKELKSLIVTAGLTEWANIDLTGKTSFNYTDSISYTLDSLTREIVSQDVITAIVTDVDGKIATATITLNINYDDPQLVATDFTWNRHGGDDATGLAEYGLEWNSNAKEIFAQIKPMAGYTLYEFEPATWDLITTENEKNDCFSALAELPSIAVFNKVSAFASHDDLDYVIGTVEQATGKAYLMHITKNVVSTFKGTDVTIYGQAK